MYDLNRVKFELAQLRHLYKQMVNNEIKFQSEAANGLLAPAIVTFEKLINCLESDDEILARLV